MTFQAPGPPRILLTGRPRVGKTTAILRLANQVPVGMLSGFFSREIRESGQRVGFEVETFAGERGRLAHVDFADKRFRVGRYGVDVETFEHVTLPRLQAGGEARLLVIDEIGKMECFSKRFVETVRELLDRSTPVVATIALKGGGFIEEVKARPDVQLVQVTRENRDTLPHELFQRLKTLFA